MALIWAAVKLRGLLGTDEYAQALRMPDIIATSGSRLSSIIPGSDIVRGVAICLCTLLCLAGAVFAYEVRAHNARVKKNAFPFMKLPAEIRAEVFTYLVEPPDKRPTTSGITRDSFRSQVVVGLFRVSGDMVLYFAHNTTHIINSLNGNPTRRVIEILGYDWEAMKETMERYAKQQKLQNAPLQRHLNNTRLVSKSFGAEFLTTYLIHANQVFTAEANGMGDNPFGLWQHALPLVKNCTLRLIARPGIANAFNPNHAKVEDWHLRESIFASMREMTSLRSMTLIIQACGNQLWNPVQLWYFISQAFKTGDIRAFNKVEFTMKDWQIRAPNYMQRTQDGWEWRCVQGHFASRDHDDLPIRPFAKKLYAQCRECRYMDPSSEEDEA